MSGEIWQFMAVMLMFVVIVVACYGFVYLPRRMPDEGPGRRERAGDASAQEGGGATGERSRGRSGSEGGGEREP